MTQLDDIDFIAVRIQHERRDPNAQLQCFAGLCNSPNQRLFDPKSRWFDKKSRVTSSIFNCGYSVFFWHLLLLEQMTKEVPGIRPAVRAAHEHGTPPMRPLYYDFPTDPAAGNLADQFMLGPDLLVAPVTEQGAVSRELYLPTGTTWVEAWSGYRCIGARRASIGLGFEEFKR